MNNKSKIVIAMSGGIDSTTVAAKYLADGYEVYPMIFKYGSKHNRYENQSAREICEHWNLKPKFIDMTFLNTIIGGSSALLQSGGDIPEGHYEADNMKQTVVPGRNLIFSAFLASYAEAIGAVAIALGVHAGDHHIYPDCRPEFIDALDATVQASTDEKVQVETPFLAISKGEVVKVGYDLDPNIPYYLTRTCYKEQPIACGKCGSCRERLEAFEQNGLTDPIEYETR